jgi:glycosyltransferase involved in cell wall biosynthesis
LLGEVIVADGGSSDATAEVADIAGCRFVASSDALGARLKAAAATSRTPWLMFLRAGCVPEPGWIATVDRFMETTDQLDGAARAAVFRPPGAGDLLHPRLSELAALLRVMLIGGAKPDQGLLIARRFYDEIGGHQEDSDTEMTLLRKIGRRRIAVLPIGAGMARR